MLHSKLATLSKHESSSGGLVLIGNKQLAQQVEYHVL